MPSLKAPFPYFGGKSLVAAEVWSRFGPVKSYVEPFAGSLAVLLGRPDRNGLETVNDADHYVANFWRALKADPEGLASLCDWPINETDLHARHTWLVNEGREKIAACYDNPDHYDLKVAAWWVWGISQWIGGGWCKGSVGNGRPHLARPEGVNAPTKRPILSGYGNKGMHAVGNQRPVVSDNGGVHGKVWEARPRLGRDNGIYAAPPRQENGPASPDLQRRGCIPKKGRAWRPTKI